MFFTQSETYDPKTIEVGGALVETGKVTIKSGETLLAGAVLGRVTADSKYRQSLAASADGSEAILPVVLMYDCDASGGDVTDVAVWIAGKFDASKLGIGTGHDIAAVRQAWLGSPMFAPDVQSV